MLESAGERLSRRAKQLARGSLVLLVLGPSSLLVLAWIEVLNNPGYSLVDAYWIERLPWTWMGIDLCLAGAVGGVLAGSAAIVVDGGWWRRILVVPSVAAGLLWWSIALGVLPFPRFVGPDPVTYAYTLPATAALLILMPAALLATLCLAARPPSVPRPRLRPIQRPREPGSASLDEKEELTG